MKKSLTYYLLFVIPFFFSCNLKAASTLVSENKSTLIATVLVTCLIMAVTFIISFTLRKMNKKK